MPPPPVFGNADTELDVVLELDVLLDDVADVLAAAAVETVDVVVAVADVMDVVVAVADDVAIAVDNPVVVEAVL